MNCQQVDKYLYDYCDNVLSPDQRALLEEHLAECHNCRQVVDRTLLETSILREEWDTPELPADFTSRVMKQIAAKPIPQPGSAAANVKRPWYRWFTGIAATAAVLLMVVYASGMVKNEKIINVADREQIASERAGDEGKVKRPATNTEDVYVGGKGEVKENINKVYLDRANKEQSSSAITPKNETPIYGAKDSTVSEEAVTKSVDQTQEKTMAATGAFPVQPTNLPTSYTIVDKVAGVGSCTYIFGTGVKEEQLTIKVAQLPLHSAQSSYSRSYVRPTSATDTRQKIGTPPAEPADGENKTKVAVEETETGEILTQENLKADTPTAKSSHTVSCEVEHNNQTYVLTITADLSPDELVALSQSVQLQSTTP